MGRKKKETTINCKAVGKKSLRQPASKLAIRTQSARLLLAGHSRDDVKQFIMDNTGGDIVYANNVIRQAVSTMKAYQKASVQKMADKNVAKLQCLLDEALEDGDRANALKAMEMMFKLGDMFRPQNQTTIISNGAEAPIVISFD